MDKKAVAEIRKQFAPKHCAIDTITGCFVDEDGSVITDVKETFASLQDDELEKYCEIFKKVLSGKLGRNLYNLDFPLKEEETGGKQWELYRTLESKLENPEITNEFLTKIRESYNRAGRHLILLAHGTYDIPGRTSDGNEMEDDSDYVYMFLVCAVCPVIEVKEGLCYDSETMTFINRRSDLGVQLPQLGFLYPAYNDRMPDIHQMLWYAKKEDERHEELIDALVGEAADIPQGEKEQKLLFSEVVEQTLGRNCDFESVKAVNDALNEMIRRDEEGGTDREDDAPLELGKTEMRRVLQESGAGGDALEDIEENFDEIVGEGKTLFAENIGGKSTMEIKSPSVKISVKSDMSAMITTKVIDGREYILIPIQDDIELNGVRLLTTPGAAAPVPADLLGTSKDGDEKKEKAASDDDAHKTSIKLSF